MGPVAAGALAALAASVAVVPGLVVRIPADTPAAEFNDAAAGRTGGHLRSSGASFDEMLVFVEGVLHRGLPVESRFIASKRAGEAATNRIQGDKDPLIDALNEWMRALSLWFDAGDVAPSGPPHDLRDRALVHRIVLRDVDLGLAGLVAP